MNRLNVEHILQEGESEDSSVQWLKEFEKAVLLFRRGLPDALEDSFELVVADAQAAGVPVAASRTGEL